MKLKEYLKELNKLIAFHPEAMNYEVIYAHDDEGNELYCAVSDSQTDLNALQSDNEKVFNYLVKRLNDSEYKVIQHRYLEGYVKDYGQIGQMLNLSRESARQLEKKALDKIKNQYARIQMG